MPSPGADGGTPSGLYHDVSGLTPEKRAMLERRLMERRFSAPRDATIVRGEGAGPSPLSSAQRRLWFVDRWQPRSGLYNIPVAARLRGRLHIDALRRALAALVARHEMLRTTFVLQDDEPVQVVAEPAPVELPLLDLPGIGDAGRRRALDAALRAEAGRAFDLSRDLMLRALLLHLGRDDHVLLLTIHHIAADGWSLGVLTRELAELYTADLEGRTPALLPLPIQYRDYAVWQRAQLSGDMLAAHLAYWKPRLAGAPAALSLPIAKSRPSVLRHQGARVAALLPCDVADGLKALSRREGVTLFITLLAAFQTLLQRYTGTDDIVVGTAVAGRRRVETEGLIGFFVNTLPLRSDLSGDPCFRDALARVRDVVLGALDRQDLPFERLVEELRPARTLNSLPLVQVMFTVDAEVPPRLALPGLDVSRVPVELDVAKFDLTAALLDASDGLRLTLEYDVDLYDEPAIRRMAGHYEMLLRGVVANPAQRLSRLPLLTDAERHHLLVTRNATGVPFPAEKSIAALFEAQAARTPEAVAVTDGDESLSYRTLNRRANQLAHRLRRLGVGPDVAVGICVPPSPAMIVGMLGILKAGGAYVPLDASYPTERLAFMQRDAGIAALVTVQSLMPQLPATTVRLVMLDAPAASGDGSEDLPCQATGEHLAYLMYTSGSTGRPKAVAVPHRAVARLVSNTNYVRITPGDAVAQASNPAFDAATFEVWGALLNGARLVVLRREVVLSPKAFAAALERHGVTIAFLTTALFNQIAREFPAAFRGLDTLLFGGETADPHCVAEVLNHGAPERLVHVYGPTETTTFAAWHLVTDVPAGTASIPIGGPITNTELYVLDRRLQPVPAGVPGEIYIGGPGLARGYLGRADLTAEKFIPHPFSEAAGARLYKTGDLARYLPDGAIDFLGRLDRQVKIRGHRIELGEIETILRRHPTVSDVIVAARQDAPGETSLVAYLVVAPGAQTTVGDVRRFVREHLPGYMVPARFVLLDALPLTPNGKVDHARLPAPPIPPHSDDAASTETAARNGGPDPLERILVQAWERVLDVRPVGTRDNLFDLGGHSLLAARLAAHIGRAVGREVPLSAVFQAPTVAQFARLLRDQAGLMPDTLLVPREAAGAGPALFCIGCPAEFVRRLRNHLGSGRVCYALAPHGFDGRRAPSTVEQMGAEYVREIRSLQPDGPYYVAGFSFGGVAAFEVAQQLRAQEQEVGLVMLIDPTPLSGALPVAALAGAGLPDRMTAAGGSTGRLSRYVRRHWAELRRLKTAQRVRYTGRRLTRRLIWSIDHLLGQRSKRMLCDWYLDAGRRVPPALRKFYFMQASLQAARTYVPRPYSGPALLVVAAAHAGVQQRLWRPLVTGGIELHVVETDHFGILSQEHVERLAGWLGAYFHEV